MNSDSDADEDSSFAPGELELLILEGEQSVKEEGTFDGDEALEERERQLQEMRLKKE